MLNTQEPRFLVLKHLQERGDVPESVLAETLPLTPERLGEVLGSLRERGLVGISDWEEEPVYRSQLRLDTSLDRSFARFLVSVLRLLRTLRKRPSWHSGFARNLRHRFSESDSVKSALWELYLDYASGDYPDSLGVLIPEPAVDLDKPEFAFSSPIVKQGPLASQDNRRKKESHQYRAVVN